MFLILCHREPGTAEEAGSEVCEEGGGGKQGVEGRDEEVPGDFEGQKAGYERKREDDPAQAAELVGGSEIGAFQGEEDSQCGAGEDYGDYKYEEGEGAESIVEKPVSPGAGFVDVYIGAGDACSYDYLYEKVTVD